MKANSIQDVGVDVAKSVFQIHAVDARGDVVMRRQLKRAQFLPFFAQLPPCRVGMEACGGAHHWARQLRQYGHAVCLMAPQFVKPFVKTNKNDRADAEAIVEAMSRPGMRFVAIKETWQQDMLIIHRVRERMVKARTALMNEIRGLLQEYGIVFQRGSHHLRAGLLQVLGSPEDRLSDSVQQLMQHLVEEWTDLDKRLEECTFTIGQSYRSHETCRKLGELPGIGPITATAMVATVGDARVFKNGRQLSAFFGLVPRHDGTGGKTRMKGLSKRGDRYVRKLLVHGARAVLQAAEKKPHLRNRWVLQLSQRRGFNKACCALANKNARRCWAVLVGREPREVMRATRYPPRATRASGPRFPGGSPSIALPLRG